MVQGVQTAERKTIKVPFQLLRLMAEMIENSLFPLWYANLESDNCTTYSRGRNEIEIATQDGYRLTHVRFNDIVLVPDEQ